jgi:hypothetical protein
MRPGGSQIAFISLHPIEFSKQHPIVLGVVHRFAAPAPYLYHHNTLKLIFCFCLKFIELSLKYCLIATNPPLNVRDTWHNPRVGAQDTMQLCIM